MSERAEEEKADILKLGRRLPRKACPGRKGGQEATRTSQSRGWRVEDQPAPRWRLAQACGALDGRMPGRRNGSTHLYEAPGVGHDSHGSSKMFFRQPHRQLTISMCRRVWKQMPVGATSTESLLAPETIPTQNSHGIMCVIQPHWHRITLYSQQEIVRKWGWGCGSAGIMLAQHTQSLEFDPQHRLNQA